MGYIDIHSHVLPGVDDGAQDLEQSVAMLRQAQDNGIQQMIVTPHQKEGRHCVSPRRMKKMTEQLQSIAAQEDVHVKLYCGNELYYRSGLVSLLQSGEVCTLAGSSYALIEFSPADEFSYIRNGLYQILSAGYYPILAHGERYRCLLNQQKRIRELIELGCYLQVNAESVLGKLGFGVRHYLQRLFQERLVHFVSTDAHDTQKRRIRTAECARVLKRKYGEQYAMELLRDNAQYVIEDMEI